LYPQVTTPQHHITPLQLLINFVTCYTIMTQIDFKKFKIFLIQLGTGSIGVAKNRAVCLNADFANRPHKTLKKINQDDIE